MMGTLLICISKMATPECLQFSYDLYRRYHSQLHGTPSLEARNIRLVNIITYVIEESKLISENMSPNVIHC
jgi:hypothetical protein